MNPTDISSVQATVPSIPVQNLMSRDGAPSINKIWTTIIPETNKIFKYMSIAMVFGLDLLILFFSPPLFPFWMEMLLVFGLFLIVTRHEKNELSPLFAGTHSKLDKWMYALICLRNIVLFLNFIPFVQLIGALATVLAAPPYLLIYTGLMIARKKSADPNASLSW